MAMTKNSVATIRRKIAKLEKGMAESKRQCAELKKTLAVRFAEENQKHMDAFRDAVAKKHIELTADDVKALVSFICDRKKETSKEESPKNVSDSDEKEKSSETKTDDKQEKKEEPAPADRDEKHEDNSDDGKNPSDKNEEENNGSGKSEKDENVEVKVADVSVSSPNGAVNPDEQKNEENVQMWSPGDNNVF